MTVEDQILLLGIRPDFAAAHWETVLALCRTNQVRWEDVYATAELHSVAARVYSNLQQFPLYECAAPQPILDQFERDYFFAVIAKNKIAERTAEVLDFLNYKGVEVMLLKESALDVLLPARPRHTTANDIDLILRPRRTELTDLTVPRFLDHFKDIHFEYDYFEHHDITMNGMLPVDFERIWQDAHTVKYRGRRVCVMAPEDLLITACINSCRKRFFRLKSLCDITEIVNHVPGIRWDVLADKSQAYQCEAIVYGALVVAKKYMGIELGPHALDGLGVSKPRAALIGYLSERMSFATLKTLYEGSTVMGREVGRGLLLPYATYNARQLWKRIRFISEPKFRQSPEAAKG